MRTYYAHISGDNRKQTVDEHLQGVSQLSEQYTSIIEQNANVFRQIFGDHNVVEHHSESQFNNAEDLEEDKKHLALAAENWDAPIIVTTSVQFFESLYANRSSKCRKLHNIANSVVIFDEAQMLPIPHLLPCTAVIGTLAAHFNASAVLKKTRPAKPIRFS